MGLVLLFDKYDKDNDKISLGMRLGPVSNNTESTSTILRT